MFCREREENDILDQIHQKQRLQQQQQREEEMRRQQALQVEQANRVKEVERLKEQERRRREAVSVEYFYVKFIELFYFLTFFFLLLSAI